MASKPVTLIIAVVAGVLSLMPASAQVVRQGNAGENRDPNAFTSPMVIEAGFVAADRTIWGDKAWHEGPDYKGLGKYTCDGIALRGDIDPKTKENTTGIAMKARSIGQGRLEVTVGLWLFNPKNNHDKSVTLLLEVLDGSKVVAQTTFNSISVEDKGRATARSFPFVVPMDVLKDPPAMKMRLTMTTKDD